jgi:hypothetical protein
VIPLAGAFLLAQGLVEIARCVICLKQGDWPSRVEDVEEVDVDKLKQMVSGESGEGGGSSEGQAMVGHEGGGAVHTAERRGEMR